MNKKTTLIVDAIINLILGLALVFYSPQLADTLGVPIVKSSFYPNILGAVLLGITLALLIEAFKKHSKHPSGLGLIGAICINLCGGLMLLYWLVFGQIGLPTKGVVLLWILATILIVISGVELFQTLYIKRKPGNRA